MLGKVYTYRDHRLDPMVEVVKSKVNPAGMYATTGIHFQPFNLSNQLCWFMRHRKELLTPGAVYLPIPSLLYYYLGGVKDVDSSWASVTQLMDAKRKTWSGPILKKLGIPAALMPDIVAPGTIVGQLTKPLAAYVGLNRAKLIAVASHDTASAFAAAPVDNPDEALIISSGTWSLVGKLVPRPITGPEAMALNVSNEGGVGNVRLLKNCMGTWLVQELRRVWAIADGKPMDWVDMTDMAKAAPHFVAFIDPDDKSFYNPANMEKAISDFCRRTKQTPPKDRGTCLRMVYESLALKYRLVNEQICRVSRTRTTVVNIVGGGSKNKMLNQFTADALGIPVLTGPEEATAVGNLMVQAVGLGIIASLHEALPIIRKAFPIHPCKPQDTASWSAAYERFRRVVT
jgi:sugar (pentulose or hexulose) kinase